jgi:5'-nucleotidase/UDP-sugar diphosphatase
MISLSPLSNTAFAQPMGRFQHDAVTNNTTTSTPPVVTNLTIVHFNDNHKALSAMPHLVTAFQQLSQQAEAQGNTVLRFNGGDNTLGQDEAAKRLNIGLINQLNVDVNVPGNHNFDAGLRSFAQGCEASTAPWVVGNLVVPKKSSLETAQHKQQFTTSPVVIDRNGDKFGVIGATLTGYNQANLVDSVDFEGVQSQSVAETATTIQRQVNALEAVGINKIILVSHMGYEVNKALIDPKKPYQVRGVDVIVGGHTHQKLSGVVADKTVFSDKDANPVVILEAGQNAELVGQANMGFDAQGKVVQVNAVNLYKTKQFSPNAQALQAVRNYYQSTLHAKNLTPTLATLAKDCFPNTTFSPENPIANLIADTLKAIAGVDIALVPSSQLKDGLPAGEITPITIKELAPFNEPLVVVRRTGKQLSAVFEQMAERYPHSGALYYPSSNVKLGITITPAGKGELNCLTLSNQLLDDNKTYSVAVPQFFVEFPPIEAFHTKAFQPIEPKLTLADCLELGLKERYGAEPTKPFLFETDGRLSVVSQQKTAKKPITSPSVSSERYTDNEPVASNPVSIGFRSETAGVYRGSPIAHRSVPTLNSRLCVTLGYA